MKTALILFYHKISQTGLKTEFLFKHKNIVYLNVSTRNIIVYNTQLTVMDDIYILFTSFSMSHQSLVGHKLM